MNKNFNTNTDNNQTWLTPRTILDVLGDFDLDPCCPPKMPWKTAKQMNSLPIDGLTIPWDGRIWLNPPYGKETWKWLEKLSEHATKIGKDKLSGLALIFARTETIGFHKEIWDKADSVFFFKGRLKFFKENGEEGGTANAPSCLISYSEAETKLLQELKDNNKLKGKLVYLANKNNKDIV